MRPWGDEPPPAPAEASEDERRSVAEAWRLWSPFRPDYRREGDAIVAEINLKDHVWTGVGRGSSDDEAAWRALLDCIERWRADVSSR
jgi:hypothetical protein